MPSRPTTPPAATPPPSRARWSSRLTTRLAVAFIVPTALVALLAGMGGLIELRGALREATLERLRAATTVHEAQLDRWFDERARDLRFLATVPRLRTAVEAIEAGRDSAGRAELAALLHHASDRDFARIVVLSARDGRLLGGTHDTAAPPGQPALSIGIPVRDAAGTTIATLRGDANVARVAEIVDERSGLGETGRAFALTADGTLLRRTPSRATPVRTLGMTRALAGQSGSGVYADLAGREVVGVYRWVPARRLALFAELPTAEAFAPAERVLVQVLGFGLLAIVTLGFGLAFVARQVARPVLEIADAAGAVARGDLDVTAPVRTTDEIGQLATAFNAMTGRLRAAHGALEDHVAAIEAAARDTEDSRRLLRAVVDHLPAVVAVKDLDGRYLMTNAAFAEFHRISATQAVGRGFRETLAPEVATAVAEADARVLTSRATVTGEETWMAGGMERAFLTARFPLVGMDGAIFALGVVATDITERKRLERQILHQQKLEAVGRLAGGVAHDMNNLLTAVRCNAELLLDGMAPDDPDRGPLEEIDRSVRNGSALTRQLLTFSRAHAVRPSALDVNRILGGMAAMLRRYVGTGIEMRFDLAGDLWLVRADEGQMEQVLLNLLSNAHDAMPAGGTATVSTRNVTVGGPDALVVPGLAPGEYVRLAVEDTGTGIDPDVIPLLFEPFFTTKEAGRGTGLGLSTAYAIVQQALGTITVDSVVGAGTTFGVYLPRQGDEPFVPAAARVPVRSGASGETVLVVDDEPSVGAVLRRVLAGEGYQVLAARTGAEALELFAAHEAEVDVVLTDVFMQGMSGSELAARIHARRPGLPVVFMSGYTLAEVQRRGLEHDEAHFLQKPFNKQHLVALLDSLLHRAAAD